MAINCEDIVNWLKTWFTPRNEDYNYDLSVSDYNPVIDSTVTVGVNVTDGNGEIVNNHSFKLWINDESYETLTTNNEGYASYTFTCSDWGIVRFTAETKNTTVIRVTGWKTPTNTSDYTFSYNHELCELRIHIASTSIPATPEAFGGFTVPSGYRPATPVVSHIFFGNRAVVQVNESGVVSRVSFVGALSDVGVYATLQWKY